MIYQKVAFLLASLFAATVATAGPSKIFGGSGKGLGSADTTLETILDGIMHFSDEPKIPCCGQCQEPLQKYHSVDYVFNNCGEACMDPSMFWMYKVFEPGLEKSDTNTPCADRNFTVYKNTPTHSFPWPQLAVTLDLFAPSSDYWQ